MPQLSPDLLVTAVFIQLLISGLFCRTLYRTMIQVKEENRTMKPGMIWLLMIPGVEKIWNFRVVAALSESLRKELEDRDFEVDEKPGFNYGMLYAALSLIPVALLYASAKLELVAGVMSILGIIFFVQYWVKINWYQKVLENDTKSDNPEE